MNLIKKFLLTSKNIQRDSSLWNMTGSMIMAFQSVIMLMILTRTVGLNESGVFTIAYANANLFLTIGKFGIRNYQVSDVKEEHSFYTYKKFRIITVVLMLFTSALYIVIYGNLQNYSLEKSLIVIWMCIFKAVDAYEDVYHGYYQQHNRLDIAGKSMTIRMIFTVIVFGVGVIVLRDLLFALIITTVLTAIVFIILNRWCYAQFMPQIIERKSNVNLKKLVFSSLPLFIGTFLAFYIGNAPKYAIDSVLNDEMQACYGFIAMPVFIIGLLNSFIFNPIIRRLSGFWVQGNRKSFLRILFRQTGIIVGITAICILGAYFVGIPVLSILYNTDLTNYKIDLIILLVGGGFLAFSGLLVTAITIIRNQRFLAIGYVVVAVCAAIFSTPVIRRFAVRGASFLYTGLMLLLCIFFLMILLVSLRLSQMSKKN